MPELRDYVEWHQYYDDPDSDLSWRLATVQSYLREALEGHPGPIRALSLCAGEGRDLLAVLEERDDANRVQATLVELHPEIAERARARARGAGLSGVEVRTADAGATDSFAEAVPAEIVLLMGIFGNITDDDIETTITTAPQLCAVGATLVWSRGLDGSDLNDRIRSWFAETGFSELHYDCRKSANGPALGAMRFDGQPQTLEPGRRLFSFIR